MSNMLYLIFLLPTCFVLMATPERGNGTISHGERCKVDKERKSVDCSYRDLSEIPNSTFPSDTREVDLKGNFITNVKNFTFIGVPKLRILDLSNNKIQHLEPNAFEGLARLVSLNLNSNPFKLLPELLSPALFGPLVNLSTLRIQMFSHTQTPLWKGIDEGFAMLINLQELFMDIPEDFVFGNGFAKLTKLQTLSTADRPLEAWGVCKLRRLTNETFKIFANTSIKELRLINCDIVTVETGTFLELPDLSILDMSNNNKMGLGNALKSLYGLQHRNMEEINFSLLNGALVPARNFMLYGSDTIYLRTICVRCLDFSKNYIFYLGDDDVPSFGIPACLEAMKSHHHALRYVPILFFFQISKYKSIKYFDVSAGFGGKEYRETFPPTLSAEALHTANISGSDHLTTRPSDSYAHDGAWTFPSLPPLLVTLNISNLITWIYLDRFQNITVKGSNIETLDLSYNGLNHCRGIAIMGLENLTQLDLSGLQCDNLHSFLTSFPKLRKLKLRNNPNLYLSIGDFQTDGNKFRALRKLQELDLSANKLTDINKDLFVGNSNLRIINLSNNKLQRVPSAIMQLEKISRLDLSFNAFTHLTEAEMSRFDRLNGFQNGHDRFHLSLMFNPFQCTCETLDFIRWVYTTEIVLDHEGNYTCALPNGSRVDLAGFRSRIKDFSVSCISHTWLIVSIIGVLFLALMIPLVYVVYRFRINLRYWFYTKLTPPTEFLVQKDYTYDAFTAYCEDNYQWVRDDLCKTLEHGENPAKLCVHNRDFMPGKPIHENIVDKMRLSKKIVLVISVEFLNSTYGPLEIEYAGMKSLEEGREDIIICILLEEIPVHEMPKPLRNLWHKITFMKWPEDQRERHHFWKQLRDAITQTRD